MVILAIKTIYECGRCGRTDIIEHKTSGYGGTSSIKERALRSEQYNLEHLTGATMVMCEPCMKDVFKGMVACWKPLSPQDRERVRADRQEKTLAAEWRETWSALFRALDQKKTEDSSRAKMDAYGTIYEILNDELKRETAETAEEWADMWGMAAERIYQYCRNSNNEAFSDTPLGDQIKYFDSFLNAMDRRRPDKPAKEITKEPEPVLEGQNKEELYKTEWKNTWNQLIQYIEKTRNSTPLNGPLYEALGQVYKIMNEEIQTHDFPDTVANLAEAWDTTFERINQISSTRNENEATHYYDFMDRMNSKRPLIPSIDPDAVED